MSEYLAPHLQLKSAEITPLALVVGDPARAKKAANRLEDVRALAQNREYHTYIGKWQDKEVMVTSHGVGGGGASICFEELIQCGVHTIIRAGTCGSLQPEYREASLIIATGAVRSDGITKRLIPISYPAIAHYEVVQALEQSVKKQTDITYGIGLCVTDGPFYDGPLGNQNELWAKADVLAIEMEVSVLYIVASLHGIRAGAILNVDNYIFERETYEPNRDIVHQGTERMLEIALDAIAALE